jgi:AAA15 family ATPase/GTPase
MLESPSLNALSDEMLYVLMCMQIDQKMTHELMENLQQMSRQEFVDKLILHNTLNNDLVVRLNKFVDKSKGSHSLFQAIKELEKTPRAKLNPKLKEIEQELSEFVKNEFQKVKNKRDKALAHLEKGTKLVWDEPTVIYDSVKKLLGIMDNLSTKKINYHWKYGSHEGKIDLRQKLGLM